jgi:chromosomal replication initiator protein
LRGITISDQVSEYIAQKVQANIRELEGALTTIYAVSLTTNEEITLKSAREALEDQIMLGTRAISITDIIDVVTNHFNVRLSDLQSKRRSQSIALPRQICMYLARQLTRHSLEEIGGHLGGRDHTTVMHACSKIKDVEENDSHMKTLLEQFSKQITQMQYS